MPVRIFELEGVPPDEAEGVRETLAEAGLEFYETPPETFGDGGAIWMANDEQASAARAVIDAFEAEWRRHARQSALLSPVTKRSKYDAAIKLILFAFFLFLTLAAIKGLRIF